MLKNRWYFLLFFPHMVASQVAINSTITTPSAILELNTDNKNGGLLLPRITLTSTTDQSTIPNPANGLMVFNTADNGSGATKVYANYLYYFDNNEWKRLTTNQDLLAGNPDLPYIVAYGRKTTRTSCTDKTSDTFNLDVISDSSLLTSSGQLIAPSTGYYHFTISNTININGNPNQSFTQSPYITADGITTYTTRFRGSGLQSQPRTITGIVYLLKNQITAPFYWNLGTNNTCTTVLINNTIPPTTPHIGAQEVVWEYIGT